MLKRFSHFFACLLLVIMPLQGFAAANMAVCNSLMQTEKSLNKSAEQAQTMPCHQHTSNKSATRDTHQNMCKATCATLCANLHAMTVIPSNIKPASMLASSPALGLTSQTYASITLPNLQRPPILLS